MLIPDKDMSLRSGEWHETDSSGVLYVVRRIRLNVCRCRQCKDECKRLGEPPHTLCSYCNNNHSQCADTHDMTNIYAGPFTGPRPDNSFADLDPATMTCRLCGGHWGESHDFPGRCYIYNRDGSRFAHNIDGAVPPFKGKLPDEQS